MPSYTNPAVPHAAFLAPGIEPPAAAARTAASSDTVPAAAARTAGNQATAKHSVPASSTAEPRTATTVVPTTFHAVAARIDDVVAELETIVANLPPGRPKHFDAKALRSAAGKLAAAAEMVEKAVPGLGIDGSP